MTQRRDEQGGIGQPPDIGPTRRREVQLRSNPISASIEAISQTRINWVRTLHAGQWQDLYTVAAGKRSVEIPEGSSWELHVEVQAYSDLGGWAQACSMVATGVPAAYARQCLSDRKVTGGALWVKEFGFNMGPMPMTDVSIASIKHWVSEQYTVQKPPEDQW